MITIEELAAKQKLVLELQTAVSELERAKCIGSVALYYNGYGYASSAHDAESNVSSVVRTEVTAYWQRAVDAKAAALRQQNVDPASLLPKAEA